MFVKSSLLLWAVIQVLILGSQTMPQPTPSKYCPPPWFSIGNECFRVVTETMHNWDSARTHCQAQAQCGDGDLAQPSDFIALAEHIFDNGYPTGYTDGYWYYGSDLTTVTEGKRMPRKQCWVNNSIISTAVNNSIISTAVNNSIISTAVNNSIISTARGWGPHQPNDDYSADVGCGTSQHFICEQNLCDCPMPWFRVGHECFLRVGFSEGARNWASARTYCGEQASGADLAQPNDIKALADYLTDNGYDRNYYYYWVGGSDLATEGDWCWINGTAVNINRKFESSNADCLTMWIGRGSDTVQLYDRECDVKWPFICERH